MNKTSFTRYENSLNGVIKSNPCLAIEIFHVKLKSECDNLQKLNAKYPKNKEINKQLKSKEKLYGKLGLSVLFCQKERNREIYDSQLKG